MEQKNAVAKLNFDCLLADEISRTIGWGSEKYKNCMNLAKETFDEIKNNEEENSELKSHFYYCYGRYQFSQKKSSEAEDYLKRSLQLRRSEQQTDQVKDEKQTELETVDQVVTLTLLGRVCKAAKKDRDMITHLYEALGKPKQYLGNHELTLNCYKKLGDAKLQKRDNEDALGFYDKAEEIRNVFGITESNVSSVYFLRNRGSCLFYLC